MQKVWLFTEQSEDDAVPIEGKPAKSFRKGRLHTMKSYELLDAVGGIDAEYIRSASTEKKRSIPVKKWIAIAACLCLVAVSVITIQYINSPSVVTDTNHAETAQEHILDTPQEMTVKIVGWAGDGFRVTVV